MIEAYAVLALFFKWFEMKIKDLVLWTDNLDISGPPKECVRVLAHRRSMANFLKSARSAACSHITLLPLLYIRSLSFGRMFDSVSSIPASIGFPSPHCCPRRTPSAANSYIVNQEWERMWLASSPHMHEKKINPTYSYVQNMWINVPRRWSYQWFPNWRYNKQMQLSFALYIIGVQMCVVSPTFIRYLHWDKG